MTNFLDGRDFRWWSLRMLGSMVAIAALAVPVWGQSTQVSGFVIDEAKNPVAGALIRVVQTFSLTGSLADPIYGASLADGSFQFTGLTPGTYRICPTLVGGDLLDPCQWSDDPPTVNVAADQAITGFTVRLTRGTFVHLDVQDPKKLLRSAKDGKGDKGGKGDKPGMLLLGLRNERGRFFPAEQVVDEEGAKLYRVLVAFDGPVTVQAFTAKLKVTDDHDKVLGGKNAPQAFRVRRGEGEKCLHLKLNDDGN